jgi:hypothetical protein
VRRPLAGDHLPLAADLPLVHEQRGAGGGERPLGHQAGQVVAGPHQQPPRPDAEHGAGRVEVGHLGAVAVGDGLAVAGGAVGEGHRRQVLGPGLRQGHRPAAHGGEQVVERAVDGHREGGEQPLGLLLAVGLVQQGRGAQRAHGLGRDPHRKSGQHLDGGAVEGEGHEPPDDGLRSSAVQEGDGVAGPHAAGFQRAGGSRHHRQHVLAGQPPRAAHEHLARARGAQTVDDGLTEAHPDLAPSSTGRLLVLLPSTVPSGRVPLSGPASAIRG